MSISTRRAVPADTEAIFTARTAVRENHLSREQLASLGITPASVAEMLKDPNYSSWVAVSAGEIVGFSMGDTSEGYVFALFALREFEGRGIGRNLLALIEQEAQRAGRSTLWLSTGSEPEIRARGFYRHLGWLDDGCLDDGQIVFRKQLTNLGL